MPKARASTRPSNIEGELSSESLLDTQQLVAFLAASSRFSPKRTELVSKWTLKHVEIISPVQSSLECCYIHKNLIRCPRFDSKPAHSSFTCAIDTLRTTNEERQLSPFISCVVRFKVCANKFSSDFNCSATTGHVAAPTMI